MVQRLHEDQQLTNITLALDIEISTYRKLLEAKESQPESGMWNMNINAKTTSNYSRGLSSAYRVLLILSPSLSYGLSSCQSSFGSSRRSSSFSCVSSSKALAVNTIETCSGKLVSKPST